MKKVLVCICFVIVTIGVDSCRKGGETDPPPTGSKKGKPTAKGLPVGDAATKTLGPEGGTLSTPDQRISITVPAGTVSTATVFSIQPIENKAPNGVGLAYRLLPEGITFARPVTIRFHYDDSLASGSLPQLLYIAYQDSQGIWKAQRKSVMDGASKTLSVTSLHFSDWVLFENFRLEVGKAILQTNESTTLTVKEVTLLASVTDTEADLDEVNTAQNVGNWQLEGQGLLSPGGASASYTAPPVTPAPNPVTISAEVRDVITSSGTRAKIVLFANIWVADNYMEVKFGDATYRFTDVEGSVGAGMIVINGSGAGGGVSLNINMPGPGSKSFDLKERTPTFVVAAFESTAYASYYDECNPRKTVPTAGSISITAVGPVDDYIDGTFTGTLAKGDGPCDNPGFKAISGRFHCRRKS